MIKTMKLRVVKVEGCDAGDDNVMMINMIMTTMKLMVMIRTVVNLFKVKRLLCA